MPNESAFDESRRLTGSSIYFDSPGVALETLGASRLDEAALLGWQARVAMLREAVGWPHGPIVIRRHASGASLAFAAPIDQLYTAAEADEWAWLASLYCLRPGAPCGDRHAPGHPAPWDETSALHTLRAMAAEEANPALIALLDAARARGVPAHVDDDQLSIGEGAGHRAWPVRGLPAPNDVPWASVHGIPLAVVTGSNGKTTTVRLLAAMARAQGWSTGYSSTDGLFVGARRIDSGDYSGPVGARTVLRQTDVDAAILETARGGLLRRGVAIRHARVAVVTNVSPDHFGEYGVHDLGDLAQVKLSVAKALAPGGLLVLNADDPLLLRRGAMPAEDLRIGWFARDYDQPHLRAHRDAGGATCGVRDGRLWVSQPATDAGPAGVDDAIAGQNPVASLAALPAVAAPAHTEIDLGAIAAMPITLAGSAGYNIANVAAAALGAVGLGIGVNRIAAVLAQFGAQPGDNPGRLQRWRFGDAAEGLQVVLDYAHNPDGLQGLLEVASTTRGTGRLGLILGQAGNREDRDIRALAAVAAQFRPDRVWLKDIGGDYMRGRAAGDIAAILGDELRLQGLPDAALVTCLDETRAAHDALLWARPGDVLVLPIHEPDARDAVVAVLDRLHVGGWLAGSALPDE